MPNNDDDVELLLIKAQNFLQQQNGHFCGGGWLFSPILWCGK